MNKISSKAIMTLTITIALLCFSNVNATPTTNAINVGGVVTGVVYEGSTVSDNLTIVDFDTHPNHHFQDTEDNVNILLNEFGIQATRKYDPLEYTTDEKEGSLVIPLNDFTFDYISIKWAASNGGWFLYDLTNLTPDSYNQAEFTFSGLNHGLSHINYWEKISTTLTTAPVPEPTTILLFGSGLIGMATIGRKRLFK